MCRPEKQRTEAIETKARAHKVRFVADGVQRVGRLPSRLEASQAVEQSSGAKPSWADAFAVGMNADTNLLVSMLSRSTVRKTCIVMVFTSLKRPFSDLSVCQSPIID